jgi:hypothetical protein
VQRHCHADMQHRRDHVVRRLTEVDFIIRVHRDPAGELRGAPAIISFAFMLVEVAEPV